MSHSSKTMCSTESAPGRVSLMFVASLNCRSILHLIGHSLLALATVAGCSKGPTTYQIQGNVTVDGKPISNGLINFKPTQGVPLGGGIAADGSFEFELPAGTYQVRIDAPPAMPEGWKEGDPLPPPSEGLVPQKYKEYSTSGLSFTVQPEEEAQTKDFPLEISKKK